MNANIHWYLVIFTTLTRRIGEDFFIRGLLPSRQLFFYKMRLSAFMLNPRLENEGLSDWESNAISRMTRGDANHCTT
ncbi:hypothetical protein NL492_26460, partial [Klebsiella pneumoniae]|nr:hypothetical protein [Klebsiella pneumoniae]